MIIGIIAAVAIVALIGGILLFKGCEAKEYKVTFNQNNGQDSIIVNVKEGETVERPKDPVREGYTFLGWYLNNQKFDFSTKITEDLTLEAKYEQKIIEPEPSTGTLSVQDLSLMLNQTGELVITSLPSGYTKADLIFRSSDETMATVDDQGKVTALKAGSLTIIIETKDGKYSVTCQVRITKEAVAVKGVKISGNTSMTVGTTQTLKLTFTPEDATNRSVTWESNNTGVAKVDKNGKVTALKEGTVVITVTTKDGNFKDSITITVKAAPKVAVTSVSIAGGNRTMTVGDTAKLTANVAPTNASDKNVTWSSSNSEVVSVDQSGNIKALKEGKATITVTTKDGNKTASIEITVNPKPINYTVTFTPIIQEVTGSILQYEINVTKDGVAMDYKAINFTTISGSNRTITKGNKADAPDISNGTNKVTNATIILSDGTKITTNVTVVVK